MLRCTVTTCPRASTNGSKSNGEGEVRAGLEVVAALREELLPGDARCSSPIRRERSRQSLLHGGEQPAGDARPRPAVDNRLPGGLPQHVVLGWRKCEHLIQLAGEIGRIAGLEGC